MNTSSTDDKKTYHIVRFHQHGDREVSKEGLTRKEAQAHCNDPETSSKTCTTKMAKEYTAKHGPWFDGFEEE